MSQQVNINETITMHPTGATNTSNMTTSSSYPASYGWTDSDSTTYARYSLSSGSTGYTYLTFDTPNIPSDATIDSITATVKVYINSTSRITNTVCQFYCNNTAKGTNYTFASTNSSNVISMTNCGSWTLAELKDMQLKIGGTGSSSSGSGGSSRYIYFYGATVSITYSLSTTQYTIAASSLVNDITVDPASQTAYAGESVTIRVDCNDITDYTVTDNDIDISSFLIRHNVETGGTLSQTAASSTYSGLSSGSNYATYGVGHTAESPYSSTGNMYASNGSTGHVDYQFDFSDLPSNATISTVQVKVYGKRENNTIDSTHIAKIGLYSSDGTLKSTEEEFTSTTATILTITNPGTWTRAELLSAYLRFTVGYYGGAISGITWNVTYTLPNYGNLYYWTYTISDMAADHVVVIDEAGAAEIPEEDPQYTYWPITISSINATTNPANGTTRIVEGSNQTITITPTDPQLTLALDNGVDITSQLVGGTGSNTYTVTEIVTNASYGFALNNNNYYESNNNGVSNSAAVCRINFEFDVECLVTIQYINYAESTYDYGIFGAIDTALGTTYSADSGAYLTCSTSAYNVSTAQTLTYTIPAGSHYIDIKYRKDTSTDSNNDSLQWKITAIEPNATNDYAYTLTNITARHNLVFVFGNVNYYYITSSSSGDDHYITPDGQLVVLEGGSYKLTVIPNNVNSTVTITDNGIDVTSSFETLNGTDKEGNSIINYIYRLSDIQATHNLIVTVNATSTQIYIKENGSWVTYSKVYIKTNGSWVETNMTTIGNTSAYYRKIEN